MKYDEPVTLLQKDSLSRWVPTAVAVLTVLTQVFYFGGRIGSAESDIKSITKLVSENVTRLEYLSDRGANNQQFVDVKQSLRDINLKLDHLAERK